MKGPNSFYECAAVTIFISTILGISPLCPFKQNNKLKFKAVKAFHLITIIYIGIFSTLLIQSFNSETSGVVKGKYYKSNRVSSFGLLFEFTCGVIIFYTIYTCSIFKTSKIHRTLENISQIDVQLKKMGQKFNYWRDMLYQIFMLALGMTMIFVIQHLQIHNITREKLRPLNATIWTILIFPIGILNFMDCQFAYTVLAIHNRFKMINIQIDSISTLPKSEATGM